MYSHHHLSFDFQSKQGDNATPHISVSLTALIYREEAKTYQTRSVREQQSLTGL